MVEAISDQILMSAQLINCFQNPIVKDEDILVGSNCINALEPN